MQSIGSKVIVRRLLFFLTLIFLLGLPASIRLIEIQKINSKIILLSPGSITRTELKNLKQNINFQGISFLGALIIDLESFSFSENYLKRGN